MKRYLWLVCLGCSCIFQYAKGQDPVFSQFYSAPLQINPAFTGNSHGGMMAINYRNQWPSINQAYVTYALSYDQYVPSLNSGFGVFALADDAGRGLLRTYNLTGLYSYRVQLGRDLYARLGVEVGFISPTLDWSKLIFLDQIDPEFGYTTPGGVPIPSNEIEPDQLTTLALDIGTGLLVYSKQFYGGVSLKHINGPDLGFIDNPSSGIERGLPLRITVHGGAEIPLDRQFYGKKNSRAYLSPAFLFVKQGAFTQLNIGTMATFGPVMGGLWYRQAGSNPDAIIFALGTRYEQFKITYSYDFTISKLYSASGGSHEISFVMQLNQGKEGIDISDCFQLYR